MSLTTRAAPFSTGGSLYSRYASCPDPGLMARFDHYPHPEPAAPQNWQATLAAFAARARAIDREYTADRQEVAGALLALNQRLGAPPAALAATAKLAEAGTLAVVSGQQAGLLGGPLYTLYKAIGVVTVAARLQQALGRPVVPVFWAATEDHDLAEVDHTWLLDRNERWRRLRFRAETSGSGPASPTSSGATAAASGATAGRSAAAATPSPSATAATPGPAYIPGASVGSIPLSEAALAPLFADLEATLPGGPTARDVVRLARDTAAASATFGEWFCRLIAAIAGPLGLVVVDPMDLALRRAAAPGVATVLSRQGAIAAGLQAGRDAVLSLGYSPQLDVSPEDAQMFWYPSGPTGQRVALVRHQSADACGGQLFSSRTGGPALSLTELLDLVQREPERFSGNVVTRPLLQDTILPTIAYLAGPGEVAYYAMLRECYHAVGRTMPVIWPRPSYTFVEPAIAHLFRKRGLDAPALPQDLELAASEVTQAADQVGIEELFGQAQAGVESIYGQIQPALAGVEDVLGQLASANRMRVERELDWLRRKAWQVARQRAAIQLGQIERIGNHLWPRGGPQERTACMLTYLARYGWELTSDLAALDPGPPFAHHYVFVG